MSVNLIIDENVLQPEEKKRVDSQLEYFAIMGKTQRKKVTKWYLNAFGNTKRQRRFINNVGEALNRIDYDYKIAVVPPSLNKNGELFYQKNYEFNSGTTCIACDKKAKKFAPMYESGLATIYELYLWYAYKIAIGNWKISYVCDEIFPENDKKTIDNFKTTVIVRLNESYGILGAFFYKGTNRKNMTKAKIVDIRAEDRQFSSAVPVVVLRK